MVGGACGGVVLAETREAAERMLVDVGGNTTQLTSHA
jgi:hypothetical protein